MATIRALTFTEEEQLDTVTMVLGAKEAAYLAKVLGGRTGTDSEQVLPGGAEINSDLYDALTGGVFNRLYDDGVNDALRELA